MSDDLRETVARLGRPRILVVGDLILDRYLFGDSDRESPEAPVPVLEVSAREDRLGGAATVASMLARLGADVAFAGVVGEDGAGRRARRMLAGLGLRDDLIIADRSRPTTVKRRYLCRTDGQGWRQVLRVDRESRAPLETPPEATLLRRVEALLPAPDLVLVSDYGKGVCTRRVLRRVIERARGLGRRVLVDPARGIRYGRYRGAHCLTPNRTEAGAASGLAILDAGGASAAGERLLRVVGAEAVVVTLDRDGMALARAGGRPRTYPSTARSVVDVTGAGDMVFAVLGLGLASGIDYEQAVALANHAGGLEVGRLGVTPLSRDDLVDGLPALVPRTLPVSEAYPLPADPPLVLSGR